MKTLSVQEAQGQLGQLIVEANRGDVIILTNGAQRVRLTAGENLDPEEDSPALEAELVKSIDGPYTPYSCDEMRAIVERIVLALGRAHSGRRNSRAGRPRAALVPRLPWAITFQAVGLANGCMQLDFRFLVFL